MGSLSLTPVTHRPRSARVGDRRSHEELPSTLGSILAEFAESDTDWAELIGWGAYYANAESAQVAISKFIRGPWGEWMPPSLISVHRVGESLYLYRNRDRC